MIFEWIPFDQFNDIKEIGKGGFSTVYSAIWKNGLLYYDDDGIWKRKQNTGVSLKRLHNSQNCNDEFINEV
jgi:serine/threonine protein kinase